MSETQKLSKLNAADEDFMGKCRVYGASLLKQKLKGNMDAGYDLKDLDLLLDLYIDKELEAPQNAFVNSIGVLFGDYMVEQLKMKWTVVEDQYGRDYGTTIKRLNITNFPLNSVMSAIEQKRHDTLHAIYLATYRRKNELSAKK